MALRNSAAKILGLIVCLFAGGQSAFSATPPAKTSSDPEMKFVIVRSGVGKCEPDCPEWIQAQGRISAGTATKLRKLLEDKSNRSLPILLNSGGGDMNVAIEMGRLIRKYKMTTTIGRTLFPLCDPYGPTVCLPSVSNQSHRGMALDYGAYCMSACPLVLLGGSVRLVSAGAFLGLHQPLRVEHPYEDRYLVTYRMEQGKKVILSKKFVKRITLPSKQVVGVDKKLRPYLSGYVKEMGGALAIIDEMQKAAPSKINKIEYSEMQNLGLATDTGSLDAFSTSSTCGDASVSASNAPTYCVVIK